jgi:hypothetical protein
MIKKLIKSRDFKFLHPDVVSKANEAELLSILKAVSYFRNFAIFKAMYTLLYKGKNLSVDQYRGLYDLLIDYRKTHVKDYFVKGFSSAIARSTTINKSSKAIYAVMIYNHLYNDNLFNEQIHKSSKRLTKAVANYYAKSKPIHLAVIKKAKVSVINNNNLVKSITKWNV